MSMTISFRVDEEAFEGLERQGENPHEVARQAFLKAVQRLRREEALDRLTSNARDPVEPIRDSVERGRP